MEQLIQQPIVPPDTVGGDDILQILGYGSSRNDMRKRRYIDNLASVHEPLTFALRASRGLGVQRVIRGLSSNAGAIWRALAGLGS